MVKKQTGVGEGKTDWYDMQQSSPARNLNCAPKLQSMNFNNSTAGSITREKESLEEIDALSPQGSESELSSRDIILTPNKSLLWSSALKQYRNFRVGDCWTLQIGGVLSALHIGPGLYRRKHVTDGTMMTSRLLLLCSRTRKCHVETAFACSCIGGRVCP